MQKGKWFWFAGSSITSNWSTTSGYPFKNFLQFYYYFLIYLPYWKLFPMSFCFPPLFPLTRWFGAANWVAANSTMSKSWNHTCTPSPTPTPEWPQCTFPVKRKPALGYPVSTLSKPLYLTSELKLLSQGILTFFARGKQSLFCPILITDFKICLQFFVGKHLSCLGCLAPWWLLLLWCQSLLCDLWTLMGAMFQSHFSMLYFFSSFAST